MQTQAAAPVETSVMATMMPVDGPKPLKGRPQKRAQPSFEYKNLAPELAKEMRQVAAEVQGLARQSVIEAGSKLRSIEGRVEHGQFQKWVKRECGFTIRTAERWMKAAELTGENDKLSYLPVDGLLALASQAAEAALNDILGRIENGERPTTTEIKRQISSKKDGPKKPLERLKALTAKLNDDDFKVFSEWVYGERRRSTDEMAIEEPIQTDYSSDAVAPDTPIAAHPSADETEKPEAETNVTQLQSLGAESEERQIGTGATDLSAKGMSLQRMFGCMAVPVPLSPAQANESRQELVGNYPAG